MEMLSESDETLAKAEDESCVLDLEAAMALKAEREPPTRESRYADIPSMCFRSDSGPACPLKRVPHSALPPHSPAALWVRS